jgi:hypothetical protein
LKESNSPFSVGKNDTGGCISFSRRRTPIQSWFQPTGLISAMAKMRLELLTRRPLLQL